MDLDSLYSRHDKVALMFSGGKDSIACLHLLEKYLDKTIVVWVNMGANFPEIEEFMDGVRSIVPNFLEIKTNQPASIEANGYPVDVLPMAYSFLGQACTTEKPIKLRSFFDCCNENYWTPCELKIRELGITAVIRGQRDDEAIRGPIKSGSIWEGVEYMFPIQDWSLAKVNEYLQEKGVKLEGRLAIPHSSLDCWNCTAYLNNSTERMQYVKKNYPEKFGEVIKILKRIDFAVKEETNHLQKVLEI